MSDPPFEHVRHVRHVLDEALDMVCAGYFPDGLIEEAIAGIDQIEEDAAVGAAVRECQKRGLDCRDGVRDGERIAHVYNNNSGADRAGHGPNIPEALADWKKQNEVTTDGDTD